MKSPMVFSPFIILIIVLKAATTDALPVYIGIRVVNKLTDNFDKSWRIYVGTGGNLYNGMINLQKIDETFSFASEPYQRFGQYVVSICRMVACIKDHQYWEVFGTDGKPTKKGISDIYPQTGDNYMFNLTSF